MLGKFFHKFSCEYYTQLSSKNLNNGLSLKEKLLFYLHHIICTFCRRFSRQINAIDRGLKFHSNIEQSDIKSDNQIKIKLSDQRKLAIKDSLNKIEI
jgi:hypothetical protein